MYQLNVFVSHSHDDKYLVENLISQIMDKIDKKDIGFAISSDSSGNNDSPQPGKDWNDWIHSRIKICDIFLYVLSPNTVNKSDNGDQDIMTKCMREEYGAAKQLNKKMIPIAYGDIDLSSIKKNCQLIYMPYEKQLSDHHVDILVNTIKKSHDNKVNSPLRLSTTIIFGPFGYFVWKAIDENTNFRRKR